MRFIAPPILSCLDQIQTCRHRAALPQPVAQRFLEASPPAQKIRADHLDPHPQLARPWAADAGLTYKMLILRSNQYLNIDCTDLRLIDVE